MRWQIRSIALLAVSFFNLSHCTKKVVQLREDVWPLNAPIATYVVEYGRHYLSAVHQDNVNVAVAWA